ncbi:MAG: lipoyl synthase [Candidatus Omnitrophica bacterium]|nr:lipoyl synthase [Candidatus Omnitrophota bacterium]
MNKPFPQWIKKRFSITDEYLETKSLVEKYSLNSVCKEARCPNIYECFKKKYVTFLILGQVCTRRCGFCSVKKGKTLPPDPGEPEKIAELVAKLNLKYVVITSVTRDDLSDYGANQFSLCVKKIREKSPETQVELLIPDLNGNPENLKIIFESKPDVLSHNMETVPGLYSSIRQMADYNTSLNVLLQSKNAGFITKSSIMVGLGEKEEEVIDVMKDLRSVFCDFFVIGQYLQPDKNRLPVVEFIRPEIFEKYQKIGESLGFKKVFSGVFYRSSYRAEEALL